LIEADRRKSACSSETVAVSLKISHFVRIAPKKLLSDLTGIVVSYHRKAVLGAIATPT
jgi:hypothetical protein